MSTARRAPRFSWQPTSALHDGVPMTKLPAIALLAALSWPAAHARDATPQPAPAATQPAAVDDTREQAHKPALDPFVAPYAAYNKGDLAGHPTIKVGPTEGAQGLVHPPH